jgi:hypothetical protein
LVFAEVQGEVVVADDEDPRGARSIVHPALPPQEHDGEDDGEEHQLAVEDRRHRGDGGDRPVEVPE